jgi:hypothetical protein
MRIAIVADTYPPIRISGTVQMRDFMRVFTTPVSSRVALRRN